MPRSARAMFGLFFFSSRRRHTRSDRDWSSDVCSSDLLFQLESAGMRDLLTGLRPDRFEDIIAIIALYRPGPMDLIPDFIRRKQGKVPITYEVPALEEILKETYGVIVYQEQVMAIANKAGGFSLGQADLMRRAMGKKKPEEMGKLRTQFI